MQREWAKQYGDQKVTEDYKLFESFFIAVSPKWCCSSTNMSLSQLHCVSKTFRTIVPYYRVKLIEDEHHIVIFCNFFWAHPSLMMTHSHNIRTFAWAWKMFLRSIYLQSSARQPTKLSCRIRALLVLNALPDWLLNWEILGRRTVREFQLHNTSSSIRQTFLETSSLIVFIVPVYTKNHQPLPRSDFKLWGVVSLDLSVFKSLGSKQHEMEIFNQSCRD